MKDGFVKAAALTPKIRVADCAYNTAEICRLIDEACAQGAKLLVFPELCITGYTCGDLFWQDALLQEAGRGLQRIVHHTRGKDALVFVGLPWVKDGKLYNVAAAVNGGALLGMVPKHNLPNYNEYSEKRCFTEGRCEVEYVQVDGVSVPFGMNQLFCCSALPNLTVAAEICEDLWTPDPPSVRHALAGATVIVNLSASGESAGKSLYREALVSGQSARLLCAYLYASAGEGESTQDLVFSGHNLIAENGHVLCQSERFGHGAIYADLDVNALTADRRRRTSFETNTDGYERTAFHLNCEETALTRKFPRSPFVPEDPQECEARCEEILTIQAMGLKKRVEHTGSRCLVVGISGGLDSTLALLVMAKTCDLLGMPREQITAVTMPGFGTTDRTYHNACELTRRLGAELLEVDIREAVLQHFKDIGHDSSVHDVTYENSQARERTQVLMDIANRKGGLVVGTGDLSELALGWATYNGDHMSMYGVNASVPKTMIRHLVRTYAKTCNDASIEEILMDVLDTPVSPELLPPKDGKIAQKTEDLVGPYELHDFFLYYMLRCGYAPSKLYRVACRAFEGVYDTDTILKWLTTFYRRFFAQQFKRSCLPDGPKVGSVGLSPRGDLQMPSDACAAVWLEDLERIR